MNLIKLAGSAALVALALQVPVVSQAQAASCGNSAEGFEGFMKGVRKQAAKAGVSKATISVLDTIQYDAEVIKKDRAQNIFSLSFLDFQKNMVTDARIKQGRAKIAQHKADFAEVQKKYGVPPAVIAAFWALETNFGSFLGDFPTLPSLATLAWDCRRPEKFRPQLLAALQLLDQGDVTLEEMRGAWAGEIGQTQFMAYDYLHSAVDFDGDGRRDLRQSVPDVLASTANLLRQHGWKPGQPWLQEVKVPAELPWDQADIAIQHPRKQWSAWGVTTMKDEPVKADDVPVTLLLPMGRNGPAFLAYHNFTTTYLKWNESLVYSTTVAYLATRMAGAAPVSRGRAPVKSLSYKQVVGLQKYLEKKGYDVGKIDGKIGKGTRAAVKDLQMKLGLPADSYPTPDFLAALK